MMYNSAVQMMFIVFFTAVLVVCLWRGQVGRQGLLPTTLTLDGDLDGLLRLSRQAEAYFHQVEQPGGPEDLVVSTGLKMMIPTRSIQKVINAYHRGIFINEASRFLDTSRYKL